jgi:formylglycine-generating enzyme required for sulfatase activity
MRKIPAKGVNTRIGRLECQPENKNDPYSAIREVSFTNDYFMSVFELTEGQFLTLITNTVNSTLTVADSDKMLFTATPDRYQRPINVPDFIVRSNIQKWPSAEAYGKGAFPNNAASVIGNLRMHTGLVGFDLPTEAVWEYACRAGTTNDFNSGLNYSNNEEFSRLARCSENSKAGASGANAYNSAAVYGLSSAEGGTAIVGSYRPNAWGLYDMHGNLMEMCLDRWSTDVSAMTGPDPWGPSIGNGQTDVNRVFKGGVYYLDGRFSASSYRSSSSGNNSKDPRIGIRICLTVF